MSTSQPDVVWFRFAVRGIGILVLGFGVPSVVQAIGSVIWYLWNSFPGTDQMAWAVTALLGPLAYCATGLYLLLGAAPLIRYCTRGALGMCPACNYDVRTVPGHTCPECGAPLPGRTAPPPTNPTP